RGRWRRRPRLLSGAPRLRRASLGRVLGPLGLELGDLLGDFRMLPLKLLHLFPLRGQLAVQLLRLAPELGQLALLRSTLLRLGRVVRPGAVVRPGPAFGPLLLLQDLDGPSQGLNLLVARVLRLL